MNLPQKNYDPESVYRIQYKRNSVPVKAEVMSGTDMMVREQQRLQRKKQEGIVLLLIGGAVLLCRIVLDLKATGTT